MKKFIIFAFIPLIFSIGIVPAISLDVNAGYIDKENEVIVGLQTDSLLKRAMKPFVHW